MYSPAFSSSINRLSSRQSIAILSELVFCQNCLERTLHGAQMQFGGCFLSGCISQRKAGYAV